LWQQQILTDTLCLIKKVRREALAKVVQTSITISHLRAHQSNGSCVSGSGTPFVIFATSWQ